MFNQFTGVGNVGKDGTTKDVGDKTVTEFAIAVENPFPPKDDKDKPLWITVEAWGKLGQSLEGKVTKGARLLVTGKVAPNEWKDKDGKQHINGLKMRLDTYRTFPRNQPNAENGEGWSDYDSQENEPPNLNG